MTTLLTVLALIVLVPVAGCVLLGLLGSIKDHTTTPDDPSGSGWWLGPLLVGYVLGTMYLLGLVVR